MVATVVGLTALGMAGRSPLAVGALLAAAATPPVLAQLIDGIGYGGRSGWSPCSRPWPS